MPRIDKTQQYIARRQMQQEEANAAIPDPKVVPSVAGNNIPPATPSSAIDTGAPVASPAVVQQPAKVPSPVIPDLAVAPGGPTSPMNEKPMSASVNDLKNEQIPYKNAEEMHDAVVPRMRSQMIQGMSEEEAMKQGNISGAEYWGERIKKAEAEGRPLNSYESMAAFYSRGDNETPEQKKKRERREQVSHAISGLGNVIANAANLAFVAKGAVPMELNSGMKELDARRQRIKEKRDALKEKQDAMLMNAKLDDLRYDRTLEAARKEAAERKEIRVYERAKDENRYKDAQDKIKREEEYRGGRDAADDKYKQDTLAETKRSHRVNEGIAFTNAATASERAKSSGKETEKKFAASFVGKNGTYRFRDKDIASAVSSQALSRLKDSALKAGDASTVEMIKDAMADLKSAPAALEFLQQRFHKYPDVEKFIDEYVDKFEGNERIMNEVEKPKEAYTPFQAPWGEGGTKSLPGVNQTKSKHLNL